MFLIEPGERSSSTCTWWPRLISSSDRCEPTNPAPPGIRERIVFPSRMDSDTTRLHRADLGQRDDEAPSAGQIVGLPLGELAEEVPGEDEVVVRLHSSRLLLADDWNLRADRLRAPLVGVPIRGVVDE